MTCYNSKTLSVIAIYFLSVIIISAQDPKPEDTEVWEPVPKVVTTDSITNTPSDAIVLFNGSDLSEWVNSKGDTANWFYKDGIMTVSKGSIYTKESFGDCQLHIEWSSPDVVKGDGQGRGNSGVYLQSRYEVQILDSYNNPTYVNGQAASIYKQYPPLVNASKGPGEWQTYDIIFMAPQFDTLGIKVKSGTITVIHNGIVVQNNIELLGTTEYIGAPKNEAHGRAPIMLQDHGNPIRFRNIWIREL